MNKFEIAFKEKRKNSIGFEFIYKVKSEEKFDAEVIVFDCGNPFVHQHVCSKGGDLLWHFRFWEDLCNSVITYHELFKETKQ